MYGSIHNERPCCGKWPESRTGTQALRATHQFTVSLVGPWVEVMRSAPFWLRDFVGAWIFYSVLPAWPWPKPRFQRIARFAPWIGLWIGVLQALLWWGLRELGWGELALAPLVIAVGIRLGGGLHHDGLMDTADGVAAGAARRLEAMEDSRVGASGVLALAVVLLLQVAALLQLQEQARRYTLKSGRSQHGRSGRLQHGRRGGLSTGEEGGYGRA